MSTKICVDFDKLLNMTHIVCVLKSNGNIAPS